MEQSTLLACFTTSSRLREMLDSDHSLHSVVASETEFKGDRQKLLQTAGSIIDFEHFASSVFAVWMSPSVLLMTGDNHDRIIRHGNDPIPASQLVSKLAMTLGIRKSESTTLSLRFVLYWDRVALVNESLQYVVELLLALSRAVAVTSLTLTGIDETFRVAETSFEPLDAMTLEEFLVDHRDTLELIDITSCALGRSSCGHLGSASCPELTLKLFATSLDDLSAFGAGLATNLGPKRIAFLMPTQDLAELDRWPTNKHVESLEFEYIRSAGTMDLHSMKLFCDLIQKCESIKSFTWNFTSMSLEAWAFLLKSIQTHPSLERLHFRGTIDNAAGKQALERRTMSLVHCLRANQCLESITMSPLERDDVLWAESVVPLLRCNGFRKRLSVTLKSCDNEALAKALLGHVLRKVKHDFDLVRCCLEDYSNLV